MPPCKVHVFRPAHKTSVKTRTEAYADQYDVFSRIAPRVNSTPRSKAAWILFGADITFRDRYRYDAMRELTQLAANSTLPVVASYFFIDSRVRSAAVHFPRSVYFFSEMGGGGREIVVPFALTIGGKLDSLAPPVAWAKRRTALFVGHVPQLDISTTRWRIWRQLYNRSDATVASPDVWTLGSGLECARNGTWREHCTRLRGAQYLNCNARPRSSGEVPSDGWESRASDAISWLPGRPSSRRGSAGRSTSAREWTTSSASWPRPAGDYHNTGKYVEAILFASRGGCVPIFVSLSRHSLAFSSAIDYDRVALWSSASSIGSNLDLWRRWSAGSRCSP